MRTYAAFACVLLLTLCGCSGSGSETETADPLSDAQALEQRHEQITQQGILATFVNAISSGDHELAFSLLHPKVAEAWTQERFAQDWGDIRNQLSDNWKPEATSSVTGQSPNGQYEQATYGLDSRWRSISSVDLVSMQVDGQPKIVRICIRIPHPASPPEPVHERTEAFITAVLREDYGAAHNMLTPSGRKRFPQAILPRLRPILGDSLENTTAAHYRICAESMWADAVLLTSKNDPATHLELVMTSGPAGTQIDFMAFKSRLRM